jgi:hypothetical protein
MYQAPQPQREQSPQIQRLNEAIQSTAQLAESVGMDKEGTSAFFAQVAEFIRLYKLVK